MLAPQAYQGLQESLDYQDPEGEMECGDLQDHQDCLALMVRRGSLECQAGMV